MAKRGRKPKNRTIADLEPVLRAEIEEAIRSHADASAVDIYRRFGLLQRGLLLDTFSRYVRSVRLATAGQRASSPPATPAAPTWEEIERRAMAGMLERLQAGDTKMYELALVLGKRHERERLNLETEAQRRAEELHARRLAKLEPELKEALGAPEKQGSKDLRAILESVATQTLSIDEAVRQIGDVLWIEIDKQMRGAA